MDSLAADVFTNKVKAGLLEMRGTKYYFTYDRNYLDDPKSCPISYSFPLRTDAFVSDELFPFFAGLVSEGWLLKMQSQSQRIDERDFFSLLISNGEDLIGAIRVLPGK